MNEKYGWFFKNLANIITIYGLLFTTWILIIAISFPEKLWLILLLSILTGLTDFIDGIIARSLDIKSYFGSALDRLRDKIFICSLLTILTRWYWLSVQNFFILKTLILSLASLVVFIEICLLLSWLINILKNLSVESNPYGRRKMLLQFFVVIIWLCSLSGEKYFALQLMKFSIYPILLLLILAVYPGFKSLEKHYQTFKKAQKI